MFRTTTLIVVAAALFHAMAVGATAAEKAPAGATIYIGTEINLVARLDQEHEDKTILPLARSLCPNMFRITLRRLRDTLARLPGGDTISVDRQVRENARLALETMLRIA